MTLSKQKWDRFWVLPILLFMFMGIEAYDTPGWAQDFSGKSRPRKSTGGASRGGCPKTMKPLTPLAPVSAGQGGLTSQTHPRLWIYIPYNLSNATLKFVLRDEQEQDIYQTEVSGIKLTPGIIRLAILPEKASELQVGRTYTWYFEVYCKKSDRPAFTSGWIERVNPDAATLKQIEQANPEQQSQLYADQLIWYDAVSTLAEALRVKPSDRALVSRWQYLLRLPSVGLDSFTTEPITDCCHLAPSK